MPKPKSDESEKEFIARFMASPEAQSDYPDQKQRAAVAYSLFRQKEKSNSQSLPKPFKCRFIEPGLVHYQDMDNGMVLVQKPALDQMRDSFIGKPVVNFTHKDVDPKNFAISDWDGVVSKVWYNEADGWYWAEFLVWDDATKQNCVSNSYSVSCAYQPTQVKMDGGVHNNIGYNMEVLGGEYTHLAVVANPRYEGARILANSKGGLMNWKFWKSDGKEKVELKNIGEKAFIKIDGKNVAVKDLIDLRNSGGDIEITEEAIVELDGKEIPMKELVAGYRKLNNADKDDDEKKKKEKDEDYKNEHKNGKHKNSRLENCALCNAEKDDEEKEKDKKKKDDMENEHKKSLHVQPLANCALCEKEGKDFFNELKNVAEVRGEIMTPKIVLTRDEMIELGEKRYGPKETAGAK